MMDVIGEMEKVEVSEGILCFESNILENLVRKPMILERLVLVLQNAGLCEGKEI